MFQDKFFKKEIVEEKTSLLWVLRSRRSLERMINSTAYSAVEAIEVNTEKKTRFHVPLYLLKELINIKIFKCIPVF